MIRRPPRYTRTDTLLTYTALFRSAKLHMTDDVFLRVKNTPKVTRFLGASGKPTPISEAEANRILSTKGEAAAVSPKHKLKVDFEIGDEVRREGKECVSKGRSRRWTYPKTKKIYIKH